jgi:hypothetical protein
LDIQRFKMLTTKEARAAMGQRMCKEYLEDKSPQEVNVGQATRVHVMKEVGTKKWPHSMFEPVEKALYSLMSMDTMVRFRKTKDYVICALLLSTFGQVDRVEVAIPVPPPLLDEISVVHSAVGGHSSGPPSRYELLPDATTPLHATTLNIHATSSPKGTPHLITGAPSTAGTPIAAAIAAAATLSHSGTNTSMARSATVSPMGASVPLMSVPRAPSHGGIGINISTNSSHGSNPGTPIAHRGSTIVKSASPDTLLPGMSPHNE